MNEACSTPEGVIVSITRTGRSGRARRNLLNARRRHRLDHPGAPIGADRKVCCSTPEGVIVSITDGYVATIPVLRCSTPEGVIVSITKPVPQAPMEHVLLNARRRHRLDHSDIYRDVNGNTICSTPEGVIVSITNGSTIFVVGKDICSTPEGVIVSITPPRLKTG